jgi:hypothetical protein
MKNSKTEEQVQALYEALLSNKENKDKLALEKSVKALEKSSHEVSVSMKLLQVSMKDLEGSVAKLTADVQDVKGSITKEPKIQEMINVAENGLRAEIDTKFKDHIIDGLKSKSPFYKNPYLTIPIGGAGSAAFVYFLIDVVKDVISKGVGG